MGAYQFTDTLSYSKGRHLVHVGFEYRRIAQDAFRDVLSRGEMSFTNRAFTQNAPADLLLGLPTFTLAARSDTVQAARTGATNLFATDSWRVSRALTLSLGLRYEYNRPVFDANDAASVYDPAAFSIVRLGANGISRSGYAPDKNNLAPRIGLAWRPGGTEKLVVRSGWGIYYNFSDLAAGQGIYFNPPFFNSLLFFPSQQAPLTIANPWPEGQAAPLPPSLSTYDANLRTSYAQQWNFSVQTELLPETVLTVGYNGSRGTKLLGARDINQPAPSPAQPNLRPLPQFSDINQIASAFDSGLPQLASAVPLPLPRRADRPVRIHLVEVDRQCLKLLPLLRRRQLPAGQQQRRGRARPFELRYAPPFCRQLRLPTAVRDRKRWLPGIAGAAAKLVNDWQINGIVSMQSGQPYSAYLPGEFDNSNTGRSLFGFGAGDRRTSSATPTWPPPTRSSGSTPARSLCLPTARSATPGATSSAARDWPTSTFRCSRICASARAPSCNSAPSSSTCSIRRIS